MRALVLGGTGRVGRLVVSAAVERGYSVTVLTRDPSRAAVPPGVRVVQGDALDPDAVDRAVPDHDAVGYALGPSGTGATTLFSDSTRILVAAMERHRVARLVAITGVGAGETKGHGGFLSDRVFFPLFTRKIYEDKDRQEALIRGSRLNWTIVRPAAFVDWRKPRGPLQAVVDVGDVTLRSISRAEVATFVLDELESRRYLRQSTFIGHP